MLGLSQHAQAFDPDVFEQLVEERGSLKVSCSPYSAHD